MFISKNKAEILRLKLEYELDHYKIIAENLQDQVEIIKSQNIYLREKLTEIVQKIQTQQAVIPSADNLFGFAALFEEKQDVERFYGSESGRDTDNGTAEQV